MKASQKHMGILLIFALGNFFSFMPIAQSTSAHYVAQIEPTYHIEKQWVKIWINKNGTIDLLYNVTLVCDSGAISWIRIGQPNEYYTVGNCTDENGQPLINTKVVEDSEIGVKIFFKSKLDATINPKGTVILLTRVDRMVWEDEWNPGNVGIVFIPTWWPYYAEDSRIAVVLPGNVSQAEIKCSPNWNNTFLEDGNRTVYWQKSYLAPYERFQIGVSFPKYYVNYWYSKSIWEKIVEAVKPFFGPVFAFSMIAIFAAMVIKGRKKLSYADPRLSMEVLGVRKGLTAVEAAVLLDVEPRKILTMILFGLLRKNAVDVIETEPYLRLKILSTANLHYYEIDFIDAVVKPSLIQSSDDLTGTLDDKKLSDLINNLYKEVDEKVKYYCRADTIAYYRKVVGKAWAQVSATKTPEVKAVQFNENLEWLVIDPKFKRRTKEMFRGEEEIPSTSAWWLPYWVAYHSPPSFRGTEGQPATPPTALPAVQFADAVVTSIESTANRIVRDIETFSKAILPPPASSSGEGRSPSAPVHSGGCVCACASCACACACASCACACASGGAG